MPVHKDRVWQLIAPTVVSLATGFGCTSQPEHPGQSAPAISLHLARVKRNLQKVRLFIAWPTRIQIVFSWGNWRNQVIGCIGHTE
jgi:hypothetical protein